MIFRKEYSTAIVYPDRENIYQAFDLTPFENIKVVILGQDPYHGPNQAHGLAFSVQPNAKFPPSLRNMYKELADDIGCVRQTPHLQDWAKKQILIVILVGKHLLMKLLKQCLIIKNMLSLFCGETCTAKIKLIDTSKHCIIKSVHPSPLSAYRGFFGSKPYSKANAYLESVGKSPINGVKVRHRW